MRKIVKANIDKIQQLLNQNLSIYEVAVVMEKDCRNGRYYWIQRINELIEDGIVG